LKRPSPIKYTKLYTRRKKGTTGNPLRKDSKDSGKKGKKDDSKNKNAQGQKHFSTGN